jgi:ribosomal protein S27AE
MAFLESNNNQKYETRDTFTEAGKEREQSTDTKGLPKDWDNLLSDECPLCGDELVEFEHIRMWKCGCGFKISTYKKEQITKSIEDEEWYGNSFMYGNWHDESPF